MLAAIGSAGVVVVVPAAPADARCRPPTVGFFPSDVRPGDRMWIDGEAWGDACYDTGPPPKGEGYRGLPLHVTISAVQDGHDVELAEVLANRHYKFEIKVRAPDGLEPGLARVVARSGPLEVKAD